MVELTPEPIETHADLIKLLKAFGSDGCPGRVLRAAGVATPTAAAAELRRAGHEVDVVGHGGGLAIGLPRRTRSWCSPTQAGLATAFRYRPARAL